MLKILFPITAPTNHRLFRYIEHKIYSKEKEIINIKPYILYLVSIVHFPLTKKKNSFKKSFILKRICFLNGTTNQQINKYLSISNS